MVAHLPDALAAAVADPDACTARCLSRLAEEDSRRRGGRAAILAQARVTKSCSLPRRHHRGHFNRAPIGLQYGKRS